MLSNDSGHRQNHVFSHKDIFTQRAPFELPAVMQTIERSEAVSITASIPARRPSLKATPLRRHLGSPPATRSQVAFPAVPPLTFAIAQVRWRYWQLLSGHPLGEMSPVFKHRVLREPLKTLRNRASATCGHAKTRPYTIDKEWGWAITSPHRPLLKVGSIN